MTTTQKTAASAAASTAALMPLQLSGVHHLALNTSDMKLTMDFYIKLLGMRLVEGFRIPPEIDAAEIAKTRGNPPYRGLRHYFFDMGGDSLLAFFEIPKDIPKANRDHLVAMQHISFATSPAGFHALLERLKAHGVKIIDGPLCSVPPNIWSFYFYDPNGFRLEISANLEGAKNDPGVLNACRVNHEEMREELFSLCNDPDWVEEMLATMPWRSELIDKKNPRRW